MDMMKMRLRPKNMLKRRLALMDGLNSGLHDSLQWTLFCSRVMGLYPVRGLLRDSTQLKFVLKTPYTIYYIITVVGQVTVCLMSAYWLAQNPVSLQNITNALFIISSVITLTVLTYTAWIWSDFVMEVEEIEKILPPLNRNVKKKCIIVTFFTLFLATAEHFLSTFYGYTLSNACNPNDQLEKFFFHIMPWIFSYMPYYLALGILFEVINLQSTFMWTYSDLLIIVLSLYLSEHFCLHQKLLKKAVKLKHFQAAPFRFQYLKITKLVDMFNARFGIYIVTSFGFNLYWICMQLFYSLNKRNTGHVIAFECDQQVLNDTLHGIEHAIYFTFSFTFLVARTLLVFLFTARVNYTSTAPLMLLYELHPSKFDVEVERFLDQITNMKVAMSGLGFFYVTRTMILTLVGSIITYELVLLQFNT